MYDPFTGRYPITDDWQEHLERGSLGGIDYAMASGTSLPAVSDGTVENVPNYGTGGNTVRLHISPDFYVEYMHLSGFAVPNGTPVQQGQIVGYAGMTGSADGSHLHIHCYKNGVRMDFRIFVTGGADDGTSIPIIIGENEMYVIISGSTTGQSKCYLYNAEHGTRRYINPTERSILNLSGVREVHDVSQGNFDAIPKQPLTVDWDGQIIPAPTGAESVVTR